MTATQLEIGIGQCSEKGVKDDNEDFYGYIAPLEPQLSLKGVCIALADGMSGSEAGKKASHASVIGFLSDYYSTPDSWSVKKAGEKILSATNSWLYSQGQLQYDSTKGMVCTLSILILKSNTAHIFHIGDSRIYRSRCGDLEQITRDHRIWISGGKNYLNRAMGIEPRLEVDYVALPVEKGDVFLLTTDGVHDFLIDKNLKKLLSEHAPDLQRAAEAIVVQALANQSDDNLTCQIVRVDSLPPAREDEILRRHNNLPFPPPLEPGMTLDGYRIEAELHSSKRTHIYRAFDTLNNRRVILKAPSILFDDDTQYIENFLHEEWAGKRIEHENVVTVLASDRRKSCIYYVTEFIEGRRLREWMKQNPRPPIKEWRTIVEQIEKGLRAFHRMEMLHQDLKPENIMLDRSGTVKIIDFGSVRIAGIAEMIPPERMEEENLLGTLNYTAPEYHLGQRGSVKSDLYSLGVIAYEMLNGALPYGQDMPEKPDKAKMAKLNYVPSFHSNPMVPAWIDGALKKATSIDPHFRYDELSEFIYDLSNPNPQFLKGDDRLPLATRNPVFFWKTVSAVLLLCNLILLYLAGR
ncbi:MAG: protein kinase domain-containing protein [Gammaproteobacteria bacterium]